MRVVSSTHRAGRNYPSSKPRACKEVKVVNSFDVKTTFDEMENVASAQ